MTGMTLMGWLADFSGMLRREINQRLQGPWPEVRLISQHDGPMGQRSLPSGPACHALHGTEHAAAGIWIHDPVLTGKFQAIQFNIDGGVISGTNNSNLAC